MNDSQITNHKVQAKKLEQVLDTIFSEPPIAAFNSAQSRLLATLAKAKDEVLLYGKLEHPTISILYLAICKHKVVAVNFGIAEAEFVQQLDKQFKIPTYFAPKETAEAIQQVQDYLNGQRANFELSTNISILTEFQQQVLQATQQIPRGKITTYLEIARKIGNPKAVRAVGQALGRNPIPIVIPCHRVIASNGSLGGYSGGGGLETKAKLLQLEGVSLL